MFCRPIALIMPAAVSTMRAAGCRSAGAAKAPSRLPRRAARADRTRRGRGRSRTYRKPPSPGWRARASRRGSPGRRSFRPRAARSAARNTGPSLQLGTKCPSASSTTQPRQTPTRTPSAPPARARRRGRAGGQSGRRRAASGRGRRRGRGRTRCLRRADARAPRPPCRARRRCRRRWPARGVAGGGATAVDEQQLGSRRRAEVEVERRTARAMRSAANSNGGRPMPPATSATAACPRRQRETVAERGDQLERRTLGEPTQRARPATDLLEQHLDDGPAAVAAHRGE